MSFLKHFSFAVAVFGQSVSFAQVTTKEVMDAVNRISTTSPVPVGSVEIKNPVFAGDYQAKTADGAVKIKTLSNCLFVLDSPDWKKFKTPEGKIIANTNFFIVNADGKVERLELNYSPVRGWYSDHIQETMKRTAKLVWKAPFSRGESFAGRDGEYTVNHCAEGIAKDDLYLVAPHSIVMADRTQAPKLYRYDESYRIYPVKRLLQELDSKHAGAPVMAVFHYSKQENAESFYIAGSRFGIEVSTRPAMKLLPDTVITPTYIDLAPQDLDLIEQSANALKDASEQPREKEQSEKRANAVVPFGKKVNEFFRSVFGKKGL